MCIEESLVNFENIIDNYGKDKKYFVQMWTAGKEEAEFVQYALNNNKKINKAIKQNIGRDDENDYLYLYLYLYLIYSPINDIELIKAEISSIVDKYKGRVGVISVNFGYDFIYEEMTNLDFSKQTL